MQRHLLTVVAAALALMGGAGTAAADSFGQYQAIGQAAETDQAADATALAEGQTVTASVPVTIGGGDVAGGTSLAEGETDTSAKAIAANEAETTQAVGAEQTGGSSSARCCHLRK